ncbi:MAG: hypothetical protein U1F77_01770 [Kiritimatiellia bacterium]
MPAARRPSSRAVATACREHGTSLVYATHEPALADMADRRIAMAEGRWHEKIPSSPPSPVFRLPER